MTMTQNVHIGLCGAGIGGLAAAIALSRAGAQVTVLEAAPELREVGAGIQITPNVSRLLIKWGVSDIIGENLGEIEEFNLRRRDDGWWVVHRAHLHAGLAEVAEKHGAKLLIDSRVTEINYENDDEVKVTTSNGKQYLFDLFIGSDGVHSVVRKILFPDVKAAPLTGTCAYRAIVPLDKVKQDPVAKELVVGKLTVDVWMSEKCYIVTYPICGGKDFNVGFSHCLDRLVDKKENVDMNDVQKAFEHYDPRITRIVNMIPETQRWPLLVTGPLKYWSSPRKNIVLIGDAAHSMVNHMAQGAATSVEDGAFLGRCIREVVQKRLNLGEAIQIYEKGRMPKAYEKQQISFLNGAIWQLPDGPAQQARDRAMRPEIEGKPFWRSPNLWSDPSTVLSIYGYDAESHADTCISEFVHGTTPTDVTSKVTKSTAEQYMNWFLPEGYKFEGYGSTTSKL